MQIYISRDGQQFGPYSIEQVKNYMAAGDLLAGDLAWHEGVSDWVPLAQVAGTSPSSVSAPEQVRQSGWVPPRRTGASPPSVTVPEGPQPGWVPPRRTITPSPLMAVPTQAAGSDPTNENFAEPETITRDIAPSSDNQITRILSSTSSLSQPRQHSRSWRNYERPLSVTIIGWMLCVFGVGAGWGTFQTISMFMSGDPRVQKAIASSPIPFSVSLAMMVASAVVTLVVGVNVLRGRNWARWLYVISCTVFLIIGLVINPDKILLMPSVVIEGLIILFLFLPKANDYFVG